MPWHLGNLHCHSTRSDGHDAPETVARGYRDLGFHFVGITDHNRRTGPEDCGEALPGFTVLPACEYSAEAEGRPVHVNGIGCSATVAADKAAGGTVAQAFQRGVDAFRAQGAFTVLNHPNWRWSFGLDDLLQIRGAHAIEVWNGAYDSDNLGDGAHLSTEALWDAALSAGLRLWAVASDDCHRVSPGRAFSADPPGNAWVGVEAADGSPSALVEALIAGSFYASTGVRLNRLVLATSAIEIEAVVRGSVCRMHFIGRGGRELALVEGRSGRYVPRGDEGYVRCRIEDGMGRCAWTQPLFLA